MINDLEVAKIRLKNENVEEITFAGLNLNLFTKEEIIKIASIFWKMYLERQSLVQSFLENWLK